VTRSKASRLTNAAPAPRREDEAPQQVPSGEIDHARPDRPLHHVRHAHGDRRQTRRDVDSERRKRILHVEQAGRVHHSSNDAGDHQPGQQQRDRVPLVASAQTASGDRTFPRCQHNDRKARDSVGDDDDGRGGRADRVRERPGR
jgi:hypothetical protein